MVQARKVVRIRRVAEAKPKPLLDEHDVDDMLDAFALADAEVVAMDVVVAEEKHARSGVVPKFDAIDDGDGIEELTDGIVEGWEDDEDA